MQALSNRYYGGIEQLEWRHRNAPVATKNTVIVKVLACGLNASDAEILTGRPAYSRIYGLTKPRVNVLGSDIVGEIVEVDDHVKNWQVGDRIVADNFDHFGGLAQFCRVPEARLVSLPDNVSIEQAACLPQAGAIAMQALAKLKDNASNILIIGAGGGAGHLAVQLANQTKLSITAIDHQSKLAWLQQLGAHQVHDYQTFDYQLLAGNYDLVLDLVGKQSPLLWIKKLAQQGCYNIVGGPLNHVLAGAIIAPLWARLQNKRAGVLALTQQPNQLSALLELTAQGQLQPNIDQVFDFSDAKEALKAQLSGQVKGKVVVRYN